MTGNDDAQRILSVSEANDIVCEITEGEFHVEQHGDEVFLRQRGRLEGFRLLSYQMTRGGLARAIAEIA